MRFTNFARSIMLLQIHSSMFMLIAKVGA